MKNDIIAYIKEANIFVKTNIVKENWILTDDLSLKDILLNDKIFDIFVYENKQYREAFLIVPIFKKYTNLLKNIFNRKYDFDDIQPIICKDIRFPFFLYRQEANFPWNTEYKNEDSKDKIAKGLFYRMKKDKNIIMDKKSIKLYSEFRKENPFY